MCTLHMKRKNEARNAIIVSGYTRRNYPHSLPADIIKICQLFFTELYYSSFDSKQIHDKGKVYSRTEINVKGLTFKWLIGDDGDETYDIQ